MKKIQNKGRRFTVSTTVSTYVFKSLKEAEARVDQWAEEGRLNKSSCVFEVVARYKPTTKLIKVKDY